MSSARRVQAAVVVLIGVGFGLFWVMRDESGRADQAGFAPYEAETEQGQAAATNSSTSPKGGPAPAPNAASARTEGAPPKTVARPRSDDEGNRPGPDGTDPERRITNRRPRGEGDSPGADGEPPLGQLDKDDIRKGIRAVTPLVKVCYEQTLAEFPDAAGKVTIGFRIIGEDGKGRVEMSELEEEGTTLFDEKLHDCLQNRVSEAEFEVPQGGGVVNVRYPFVFATDAEE